MDTSEQITFEKAKVIFDRELAPYNPATRLGFLVSWFEGRATVKKAEFDEYLNQRKERMAFHQARPEIRDGEIVITVPANVRYFGLKLLVERASSDRLLEPEGSFMCPIQFEVDADFLRKGGFYKEPFVLKLDSSIALEQEPHSS